MPRLSLYKPEKGQDYTFLDKTVVEMFTVGGTDVFVHKYLGPKNPAEADATSDEPRYDSVKETNIQDMLFLENRDRKYDSSIYNLRGIYNVQDIDFDMSQFGLFLQNDTLFMTIPITSSVKVLGRKVMPGDVFELPHLKDEYALNDFNVALKRFYVVEDVNRAAEGFSQTWYPHIWRVKLAPLNDAQEYSNLLGSNEDENSLASLVSTYNAEMDVNKKIVEEAEASGGGNYDTSHLYTTSDNANPSTDWAYGDSLASGLSFPANPNQGDYFLRTDFDPNRLFVRRGAKWVRLYDNINENTWDRNTFGSVDEFVNQLGKDSVNNEEFDVRQSLNTVAKTKKTT